MIGLPRPIPTACALASAFAAALRPWAAAREGVIVAHEHDVVGACRPTYVGIRCQPAPVSVRTQPLVRFGWAHAMFAPPT